MTIVLRAFMTVAAAATLALALIGQAAQAQSAASPTAGVMNVQELLAQGQRATRRLALLSQGVNGAGETVLRLVDEQSNVIERVLDTDLRIVSERSLGNLGQYAVVRQGTQNGLLVVELRDVEGAIVQLHVDREGKVVKMQYVSQPAAPAAMQPAQLAAQQPQAVVPAPPAAYYPTSAGIIPASMTAQPAYPTSAGVIPASTSTPPAATGALTLLSEGTYPTGHILQRLVDGNANIVERTLDPSRRVVSQKIAGHLLDLPVISQGPTAAGGYLALIRDTTGAMIEVTLDNAGRFVSARPLPQQAIDKVVGAVGDFTRNTVGAVGDIVRNVGRAAGTALEPGGAVERAANAVGDFADRTAAAIGELVTAGDRTDPSIVQVEDPSREFGAAPSAPATVLLADTSNQWGQRVLRLADSRGNVIERTLGNGGALIGDRAVGSVLDFQVVSRESPTSPWLTVLRTRDPVSGALVDVGLDGSGRVAQVRRAAGAVVNDPTPAALPPVMQQQAMAAPMTSPAMTEPASTLLGEATDVYGQRVLRLADSKGNVVERTLGSGGSFVGQRLVGNVLDFPIVSREASTEPGVIVVRTLDSVSNALLDVHLDSRGNVVRTRRAPGAVASDPAAGIPPVGSVRDFATAVAGRAAAAAGQMAGAALPRVATPVGIPAGAYATQPSGVVGEVASSAAGTVGQLSGVAPALVSGPPAVVQQAPDPAVRPPAPQQNPQQAVAAPVRQQPAEQRPEGQIAPTERDLILLNESHNADGRLVQRLVDAGANIIERTLDGMRKVISEAPKGTLRDLPVLSRTLNAVGQTVAQLRDTTGAMLEVTLDAAGRLVGMKVLSSGSAPAAPPDSAQQSPPQPPARPAVSTAVPANAVSTADGTRESAPAMPRVQMASLQAPAPPGPQQVPLPAASGTSSTATLQQDGLDVSAVPTATPVSEPAPPPPPTPAPQQPAVRPEPVAAVAANARATIGVIGQIRNMKNELIRRVVDGTGAIIEQTYDPGGILRSEKAVERLMDLRPLSETFSASGQVKRRVRDQWGAQIEYTADGAGRFVGARVLSLAPGRGYRLPTPKASHDDFFPPDPTRKSAPATRQAAPPPARDASGAAVTMISQWRTPAPEDQFIQRVIDARGNIVELAYDRAMRLRFQKPVGRLIDLPVYKEWANELRQRVRLAQDSKTGMLIEYVVDANGTIVSSRIVGRSIPKEPAKF